MHSLNKSFAQDFYPLSYHTLLKAYFPIDNILRCVLWHCLKFQSLSRLGKYSNWEHYLQYVERLSKHYPKDIIILSSKCSQWEEVFPFIHPNVSQFFPSMKFFGTFKFILWTLNSLFLLSFSLFLSPANHRKMGEFHTLLSQEAVSGEAYWLAP